MMMMTMRASMFRGSISQKIGFITKTCIFLEPSHNINMMTIQLDDEEVNSPPTKCCPVNAPKV